MTQNNINHIVLVLDRSESMRPYRDTMIKVIDTLVEQLARQSKQLDQETRITVVTFNETATCTVYDKDVLRLPKGADLYPAPAGWTALIDASLMALEDLALTPQKYGDHSFLVYVLTDGEENRSRRGASDLRQYLEKLPAHWTVGALVPDFRGVAQAKAYGFAPGNVAVWNTTSAAGVEEVGEVIKQATDTYMTQRAAGVRGSKSLFDTSHITPAAVQASGIKPLDPSRYLLIPVTPKALNQQNAQGVKVVEIQDFVQQQGRTYVTGNALYELKTRSRIQGNKAIAVVEKKSSKVFTGPEARQLVGLGDQDVRIFPSHNPDYDIFVQSTSVNRHLVNGQRVLLLL